MTLYLTLSITALLLPLLLALSIARRAGIATGHLSLYLALGAGGWLLAKIPKSLVILPLMIAKGLPLEMEPWQFEELLRTDFAFLVVAAAAAGLFEETAKPLGLLFFRRHLKLDRAASIGWVVGLGAGLLEALNSVGGTLYEIVGPSQVAIGGVIHIPVERLMITLFHGALTAIVVYMFIKRRYLIGFGLPILIHFAIDLIIPYAQVHGILSNIWMTESIIGLWVGLTCLTSVRIAPMGGLVGYGR